MARVYKIYVVTVRESHWLKFCRMGLNSVQSNVLPPQGDPSFNNSPLISEELRCFVPRRKPSYSPASQITASLTIRILHAANKHRLKSTTTALNSAIAISCTYKAKLSRAIPSLIHTHGICDTYAASRDSIVRAKSIIGDCHVICGCHIP